MSDIDILTGTASLEELRCYWRLPTKRSARDLATQLGLRKIVGGYPWLGIWAVEGLAPPLKKQIKDLKLPHLRIEDLAELLGCSIRTAQRLDLNKPDASFPDRLTFRNKPKLWRQAPINAWCCGLPVPVYKARSMKSASPGRKMERAGGAANKAVEPVFDPYEELRFIDAQNEEMTNQR